MNLLRSFAITIAMYSKIPVRQFPWKSGDMRYSIAFLPVIGIIIGAAEYICTYYAVKAGWGYGVVFLMAAIPVIVTGGLHLDGFMDTSDALGSYGTREKKLEIMKDPHIGSFAVIRLLLYILLALAFLSVLNGRMSDALLAEFACIFAVSRLLAGFGMVYLKGAKNDGLFHTFSAAADVRTVRPVLIGMSAALVFLMIYVRTADGILVALSNFLLFLIYRHRMYREFGGITGDTEGWLICVSELLSVIMLAAGELVFGAQGV